MLEMMGGEAEYLAYSICANLLLVLVRGISMGARLDWLAVHGRLELLGSVPSWRYKLRGLRNCDSSRLRSCCLGSTCMIVEILAW